MFNDMQFGAQTRAAVTLQRLRSPHRQVALRCHIGHADDALDPTIRSRGEPYAVIEVDQLKQGLQLVIAVGTASDDMQK